MSIGNNHKLGNKNRIATNLILIVIVVLLAVIPLVMAKDAEFGGSDDQAKDAISTIDPGYKPWFSSVWEPPSGEIASLLFTLQAALGSGILFYGLGYLRGRSKREENRNKA
ncbi:MAG: Cobalt transport protein CbiN [Candidatus Dichloromethanomonas elyunquensis]|nr:MAG: Cobalt transport protein CbiN [Candidatus Dichloromethanomonas elyunquensis]